MPHFEAPSSYQNSLAPRGPHWETIVPNITRRRFRPRYQRERLELADGDFVDLDFARSLKSASSCILALHGLEGDSYAPYVASFARSVREEGWDFVAMNLRGCSGAMNRLPRFYHSGETGDLHEVVMYLKNRYEKIYLLGFSLGGNVVLKYLGEQGAAIDSRVAAGVAISAPIHLASAARRIGQSGNRFYMRRFIRLLSVKIEAKAARFPDVLDATGVRSLPDFEAFDGRYTAPLNGFASADDYWQRCSSLNVLGDIRRPSLILSARNDPFLTPQCFPDVEAFENPQLYSCFADSGGHIGFPSVRRAGKAWHEATAASFFAQH